MNDKRRTTRIMAGSILLAAGIGSVVGAWTNNIGLWVAVGVAAGVAIGTAITNRGS